MSDQRGNSISYTYNENEGTVKDITDQTGEVTTYEYDTMNNVTKVQKQVGEKQYQNSYTYENDKLKTITHNGFSYTFVYDNFGNTKQVKVGDTTLITNNYEEGNGNLASVTYGNGQERSYTYDRFDRQTAKIGENGAYRYAYDAKSNLSQLIDEVNNNTISYQYDLGDRLLKTENTNGLKIEYTYDKNSNVNNSKYTFNNQTNIVKYNYDRDNRINSIILNTDAEIHTNYDKLSRLQDKVIKTNNKTYQTGYEYHDTDVVNKTTTLVKSVKNGDNQRIEYTYDVNGNIQTISVEGQLKQKYYYDGLNQLVREDNKEQNKTITYTYDLGGNITAKTTYAYTEAENIEATPTETITYQYNNANWKDQLTSYNGNAITYDEIGNIKTYDGTTYTWQNGRELVGMSNPNGFNVTYKYNDSGIRTQKTVNGVTTDYYLEGDKVVYEKTGNNILTYSYDDQGELIGFKYNNDQYYYIRNAQTDIIGILNNNLEQVASYTYDSWGNLIRIKDKDGKDVTTNQEHIGNINPYRYRGYRYDKETGLYYLQSRYYHPTWGRFISLDGMISTGNGLLSHNMYIYCENDSISRIDPTGYGFFSNFISKICGLFSVFGKLKLAEKVNAVRYPITSVIGYQSKRRTDKYTMKTQKRSRWNNNKCILSCFYDLRYRTNTCNSICKCT